MNVSYVHALCWIVFGKWTANSHVEDGATRDLLLKDLIKRFYTLVFPFQGKHASLVQGRCSSSQPLG